MCGVTQQLSCHTYTWLQTVRTMTVHSQGWVRAPQTYMPGDTMTMGQTHPLYYMGPQGGEGVCVCVCVCVCARAPAHVPSKLSECAN